MVSCGNGQDDDDFMGRRRLSRNKFCLIINGTGTQSCHDSHVEHLAGTETFPSLLIFRKWRLCPVDFGVHTARVDHGHHRIDVGCLTPRRIFVERPFPLAIILIIIIILTMSSGSFMSQILQPGGGVMLIPFVRVVVGLLLCLTVGAAILDLARIHMVVLSVLSSGLLLSLSFFESELQKQQQGRGGSGGQHSTGNNNNATRMSSSAATTSGDNKTD
jgi:hypothetical protein